ncbi:Structural maintenance of chromosomes protein 5 [Sorochytrium milnesiophthora]
MRAPRAGAARRARLADDGHNGGLPLEHAIKREIKEVHVKRELVTAEQDAVDEENAPVAVTGEDSFVLEEHVPELEALTREKDADGFVSGSVKRVELRNFMTYDYGEFVLDPGLNMIIGPNGTGKSAFVCALAIGLAANPNVTARGNELWTFIRNGHDHGEVTVVVSRGKHPGGDLVIKRSLARESRRSDFRVNGKAATLKDDRVSALAAMNSMDLLKEVEKAAGPPRLYEDHLEISQLSVRQTQTAQSVDYLQQELQTLTNKNQSIEADYERLQQRKNIQRSLQLATILHLQERYEQLRTQHQTCKADIKAHEKQVAKIEAKIRPWQEQSKKLQQQIDSCDGERKTTDEQYNDSQRRIQRLSDDIDKAVADADFERRELQATRKKLHTNENKIRDVTNSIQKLEQEVAHEPHRDQGAMTTINEELASIQERMREQNGKIAEINIKKDQVEQTVVQTQREIGDIEKRLEKARNVAVQQEETLAKWDRGAYDVWRWIKSRPQEFAMEVTDPLMFAIRVRDPKLSQYVENSLPPQLWTQTFLVRCERDFETIVRQFVDNPNKEDRRRVGVRELMVASQSTPHRVSHEELRKLGFDGYISELLEGQPDLIEFLAREFHLADFPYASGTVDHEKIARHRLFGSYIAHNQVYRIRYHKDQYTNNATHMRPVQFLGTQGTQLESFFDQEEVDRQELMRKKLKHELDRCQEDMKEVMLSLQKERQVLKKLGEAKDAALERKQELLRQHSEFDRAKIRLRNLKTELEQAQNFPAEAERLLQQITQRLKRSLEKRAKLLQSMMAGFEAAQKQLQARQLAHVRLAHSKSALQRHRMQEGELKTELQEARQQVATLIQRRNDIKEQAIASQGQWQRSIQSAMEELESSADEIADETKALKASEEALLSLLMGEAYELLWRLQELIDDYRLRLDACRHANDGVIEEYERRLKQIEEKKKELVQHQAAHDVAKAGVEAIRARWLPPLKALVRTVSDNFSEHFRRIGCTGEVELKEDEDYSRFALQVRVKFRAEGELQILEKSRQSGGRPPKERAVSTILFLLSLQDFSKAPFRLVDEINQGMDARNERMIHRSMVESASQPHSPQYFLITPKLLTNLYYAQNKMRVHCVFNGKYVDGVIVRPPVTVKGYLRNWSKRRRLNECKVVTEEDLD